MTRIVSLVLWGFSIIVGMSSCGSDQSAKTSFSHTHQASKDTTSLKEQLLTRNQPKKAYGVRYDSLKMHKSKVQRNQNLSEILRDYDVSYPTIDKLARKSQAVFNVRDIRAGNAYCILYSEDSTRCAEYFIYEKSPINFIVYDLRDSLHVYEGQKEVTIKEKTATGIIDNSLYMTMKENNLSPLLTIKLSEIYAWTIDFYRIKKGDRFKLIYEEKFVDGESVGIGEIQAAVFNHQGEDFYAFSFEQNGEKDYFDREANSLRKAFLKAPVRYSRITSGYSRRRYHPVQKRYKAHLGVDYAAPTGTPIRATGAGTVIAARYSKYNGRFVKIRHNSTYTTQYLHMTRIKSGIRRGVHVDQGDLIGFVGSTGLATGPHVCYRFWKFGKQVNPMTQDIPPSEPVEEENLEAYQEVKDTFMQQLQKINYPKRKGPPFTAKASGSFQ